MVNAGVNVTGGTIFFTTGAYLPSANETTAGLLNLNAGGAFGSGALTIQGGWNGTIGVGSALLDTQTVFSLPVSMTGWTGTVTLNNITVTGVNDTGLTIKTDGDVNLNYVDSSFNDGFGAEIEAKGNVEVKNSTFNSNDDGTGEVAGLDIKVDGGDVTLTNVMANDNHGDGVDIYGTSDTTGPGVVKVNGGTFNLNYSDVKDYGTGLYIAGGQDDITLNNVVANFNDGNGVEIVGTTGDIKVNGGQFSYNGWGVNGGDGLNLTADGDITLNNVSTWGNEDDGAELCAGGDVNLNGNMFYYNNYGVYLRCANNVNSSYNYWWNYWYSSYWDNWYGYYYGSYDYYYSGYYNGFYYNGWALPTWGGPYVTINNIYVDGNFIPNYNAYYSFYNSYYGRFWDWGYNERGHGWRWWGWNWGWLYRGYPFQGVVTTKPMTAEITPLTEDKLPGKLPEGKTFTDAFEAKVSDGVPGEVTKVFFEVPAGFADGDTLTVLSWNEKTETWDEVESTVEDGKVNFKIGTSGTFALVTP
jgi:hypothetical protein